MHRFTNWDERLNEYIAKVANEPFIWGTHDCGLFVDGGIEAMTGEFIFADMRGKYKTAKGATRILKRLGSGDLLSSLTDRIGPVVPPGFAQRGDIVLARGSAGICIGSTALFVGEESAEAVIVGIGLVELPRVEWSNAWRVPY